MSSSTRSDRRAPRAAVLLAVVALVAGLGTPAAAAPVPLPVVAVLPGSGQTTVVVDLSAIADRWRVRRRPSPPTAHRCRRSCNRWYLT
jgi:heme A synthase